jgi:hypothetical protein
MKLKTILAASAATFATAAATGLPASSAYAQITSAEVSGRLTDDAGNPLAGVTVTIRDNRTGQVETAETSESGVFYETGLRVGGPYTISADTPTGQAVKEGVFLQPSRNSVTLAGPVGGDVIVVKGTALSGMDLNNGVGSVYSADDILSQPATDRDLIDTLNRDPLANSGGTGILSVAGANPRFNALAIDGALLQDDFGLSESTYPTERSPISLDAIESASIVASDYSVRASGFRGGLVNVITKSGTNEWDGSAYYYYQDDSFRGDEAFGQDVPFDFEEKEYGVTLGGPIVKDKLFFFVNYDEYDGANGTNFQQADERNDLDPAVFGELNDIVLDTYGIDMGGRPVNVTIPATSQRFLGKVDWFINDDHRAAFTYQRTEEEGLQSVGSDEFRSAWYDVLQEVNVYTGQINSDWTDAFSTELRVNYKDNIRSQVCGNPDAGEIRIDLTEADIAGTPLEGLIDDGDDVIDDRGDVTFTGSCDRFRHANAFDDERLQVQATGNYTAGDHLITFGGEYENYELFNLFVPTSNGQFVFETWDELISGDAEVRYNNALTNDANDAAAEWGIAKWVAFAQDRWQALPYLSIDYGLRYEYYSQDDAPGRSPAFEQQYGFRSDQNLDGLDILMPRFGFEYDMFPRTTVTGGFGLFSGGDPKVWTSNAFQPFTAFASGDFSGVDPMRVPDELLAEVAATDASVLSPIDVISPDFALPADWKASLRVDQEFDAKVGNLDLGTDYLLSLQYLRTDVKEGFAWTNLAQTNRADTSPIGTAPDGRPIYADLDALGIDNVTVLTNADGGSSNIFSASLSKDYEMGFGFSVSYAYQDVEDVYPGTSSRGISNLRAVVDTDRNFAGVGTSNFEVEHAFKVFLSYENDFIADLNSRFTLFGEVTSGDPFSYTFDVDRRNALFGRAGQGESPFDNDLLYVPRFTATGFSDPNVVFGSDFNQQGFYNFVQSQGLDAGIQDRNAEQSSWQQRWDFQWTQELPFADFGQSRFAGNKLKFVLDIENVLNLIDSDWGTVRTGPGFGALAPVGADLVAASDVAENGINAATALEGDAPRTTCLAAGDCLYRFEEFDERGISDNALNASVWGLRVGIRYEF